jgi:hypothetical protein
MARIAGSQARSEEANGDLVDQTREDNVGVNGRKAMGPVGRKRWYAVWFGPSNVLRGGCTIVATIA